MARPVTRETHGRWSLAQVAAEAGITPRTARTIAAARYIDPDRLGYKDVLAARVAAAVLDAPRPAGQTRTESRDTTTRRNHKAVQLARTVIDSPTPTREAFLAVLPDGVQLVENAYQAIGAIGNLGDQPLLVLPVGEWAHALHASVFPTVTPAAS